MTYKADILSRFGDGGEPPLFLPDLTLWYAWQKGKSPPPVQGENLSLPEICRLLEMPIWLTVQPWWTETGGVDIRREDGEDARTVHYETSAGTLTARWTLGPGGDWWQTEYPVKTADDLTAALEVAQARSYVVDAGDLEDEIKAVGDDGVVAAEIPARPYADLVQEFLGWSEGLMLLMDNSPAIQEIVDILEGKLQPLVEQVAGLPVEIVLAPDNLDGQFISPPAFEGYLAESYRRSAEALSRHDKHLLVHVGGPVGRLLPLLAEAGVSGVEGVAGPPQGDVSLAKARTAAGPGVTLWGGIPQEFLLEMHDTQAFEAAVTQAVQDARGDGRMILGVADRVPVNADLDRLKAIPAMVGKR